MNNLKSILLASAFTIPMTCGIAYPGAGTDNSNFSQLDVDHNGSISNEEAKAMPALEQYFAQVDTDSDGQVSENEYLTAVGSSSQSDSSGS